MLSCSQIRHTCLEVAGILGRGKGAPPRFARNVHPEVDEIRRVSRPPAHERPDTSALRMAQDDQARNPSDP